MMRWIGRVSGLTEDTRNNHCWPRKVLDGWRKVKVFRQWQGIVSGGMMKITTTE